MQAYEVETDDGLSLQVQKWNEVNNPARTLIIIHGLGEHQDRYKHVAEHFAEDGFQVYSYDQRGHGKSGGQPRPLTGHKIKSPRLRTRN